MDLKSGAAGSQEKRGICKKAYAEAVRRNQHQRPASVLEIPFFPSPVKKKKKIKSSGFLGKRRKKGGEGSYDVLVRLESVAAAFLLFLSRCGSHAVTLRAYRVTFRIVGRVT